MELTPTIAIHLAAALGAVVTGPVALWARLGGRQRPKLHRAFGYAWVTLMIVTAISAMFIRDTRLPNIAGYTPIHLLVPVTLWALVGSFVRLAQGNVAAHRSIMQRLYVGACLVAGSFTLLPSRFLGNLLWNSMLGQILRGTPLWVWGLLAALVALGYTQTRARQAGLARVAVLPVVMTGLSLAGLTSAFGSGAAVLGAWTVAAVTLVATLLLAGSANAAYDAAARRFTLPGSWTPMALILAIFATRYVVNVSLVLHPELKTDAMFAVAIAALYGVCSGIFIGRAARLVRLVLAPSQSQRLITA